jgi:hypothetical protein
VGCCLCDPNGHADVPWKALPIFANKYRKIDLIFNLNVPFYRMSKGTRSSPSTAPCVLRAQRFLLPHEMVAKFDRKFWFLQNPVHKGGMGFFRLFGTNIPGMGKTKRFKDFFSINSPRGYELLHTFRKQNIPQPLLPFPEEYE